MSIPLRWEEGDRCVAFAELGVVAVVHRGGLMQGLYEVKRLDGSTVLAAHKDLDLAVDFVEGQEAAQR